MNERTVNNKNCRKSDSWRFYKFKSTQSAGILRQVFIKYLFYNWKQFYRGKLIISLQTYDSVLDIEQYFTMHF